MAGRRAWQGACMAGACIGEGVYMGEMHGSGDMPWGMHGEEHTWQRHAQQWRYALG